MSEQIHGKQIATQILEKMKKRIAKLETPPGLAAILVGNDSASHLYVRLKEKAAKEVGIYFEKIVLPEDAKERTVIEAVRKLNKRDDIQGILVQLPIKGLNEDKVIAQIDPNKDVDGFHSESLRRLEAGEPGLVPPVALAVIRLVQATNQPLSGKHALIISNNPIFAHPIELLMSEAGINSQYLSPDESAFAAKTRAVDILVVAVGKADFINEDMVKEGAILIDVGTNKKEGKLVGDVSADAKETAGFVSPVPGGVGPLTVAFLMNNVLKAALVEKG